MTEVDDAPTKPKIEGSTITHLFNTIMNNKEKWYL
jgi:hypothetical protein